MPGAESDKLTEADVCRLDPGGKRLLVESLPYATVLMALHQVTRENVERFLEGLSEEFVERMTEDTLGICRGGPFPVEAWDMAKAEVVRRARDLIREGKAALRDRPDRERC